MKYNHSDEMSEMIPLSLLLLLSLFKKVFLLNPIPEDVHYKEEIKAMADVILDGDLTKIV